MTPNAYIDHVIRLYLEAPDTPSRARRSDRTLAGKLHHRGVSIELIEHAIALASLRRALRPAGSEPLEPIRSFAYLRPLIRHLRLVGVEDGYRHYVADRYIRLKQ